MRHNFAVRPTSLNVRGMRRDDEELVAAFADDREVFAELYRRYERPLLGYFVRRTRDGELAVDLTAETFAAALTSLQRDRGHSGLFGPWLFGIASNKLTDSIRRGVVEDQARRRLGLERLELTDDALEAVEQLSDLNAAALVAELPPDQRDAVKARVLDELDYDEIAAALDCSQLVARKRVSRGLAQLRRNLVWKEAP